ncbi:Bug family tripartite tricarboxylate transporter substrate binding protein [Ramlibacter rhizophilus]|uniref:Tripartite tricarboxylate transporter substrate binding protein n=1 Tax=Ramlibacter rhizophilus TaxID=1781167 RepID=A0A4Z0BMC5_9BURK|nr:tripartite tricarboxylate transporter substrate binding protein [Ramlibacter rhizophilus]TFY99970.1 tripartite tricarboxylate transporter substrate binding protein [Ramlibacter rhizophilus]
MNTLTRRSLVAAGLLLSLAATVSAQGWPRQTVTIVVPYTPGTGIDIIARTLAPRLAPRLGQAVLVDNKPGASGNIGASAVAKAAPDGHTLMITVNTFTITPALMKSMPYDPVADFAPVTKLAYGSMALVVNPTAMPVNSLDELVQYAKARPGKLNYGSPGNGTPQHLVMEVLKDRLGLNIVHVPYKGAAGANTDLLGGQIQLMVLPLHTALPFVQQGRLRVIGVSGEQRNPLAPDTPTLSELGLKNLEADLYFWLAAPAGTPPAVLEKLRKESHDILAMPEVRESLLKQGLVPSPSTSEEIASTIRNDVQRWKKFVAAQNITAD